MTLVRLEPAAPRSRIKHSTTEPLRSLWLYVVWGSLYVVWGGYMWFGVVYMWFGDNMAG